MTITAAPEVDFRAPMVLDIKGKALDDGPGH